MQHKMSTLQVAGRKGNPTGVLLPDPRYIVCSWYIVAKNAFLLQYMIKADVWGFFSDCTCALIISLLAKIMLWWRRAECSFQNSNWNQTFWFLPRKTLLAITNQKAAGDENRQATTKRTDSATRLGWAMMIHAFWMKRVFLQTAAGFLIFIIIW